MLKMLAVLLLFISTLGCAQVNSKERIHESLVNIEVTAPNLKGGGECSAYSVGPHTILTATHCLDWNTVPSLVGITFSGTKAPEPISTIVRDGDHVLVTFPGKTFPTWVALYFAIPRQGDRVFFWGNPTAILEAHDCYREGYYSGHTVVRTGSFGSVTRDYYLFVIPSAPGDSGSLIFNEAGAIVGQVSAARDGITGSEAFMYTEAQLAAASK